LSPVGHLIRLSPEVLIRTQHVSRKITWLAYCAAFAFAAFSIDAADSGIITFQESSAPSSGNASALIGHWRKTTIGYTGPIDEHLVLRSNGTVEGKMLTLSLGGNDRSSPFSFHEGQLVFPNIPNRRGFWEKIE
jgi:hypothetical protein